MENKPTDQDCQDTNPTDLAGVTRLASDHYWSSHDTYTVQGWQHDVQAGNTRLGYWDWVRNAVEARHAGAVEENEGAGQ